MQGVTIGNTILSIELVPRDLMRLLDDAHEISMAFPRLSWLNIPDIKRLPVRSYEAAKSYVQNEAGLPSQARTFNVIPHIRTRDRTIDENVALINDLARSGIQHVLIITGDRVDLNQQADFARTLDVLRAVKKADLAVNLWAAFDPYRGELRGEIDYAREKIEAGAVGFFTQPFFDDRLVEMCLDQLIGIPTFIGISPVTSERSAKYWERENRVVFPPGFKMNLDYCARLTARLIRIAVAYKQHAYLMPITVDPKTYLSLAFEHLDAMIEADTVQPWGAVRRRKM